MNCIIIEDQPPAQRILKKYIEDMGSLVLKGTFSDAIQAMEYLKTEPIDVIFLDIHLPKLSGIDFLKTMPNPPSVILTTAFSEYALESYEFNVVDYLLKPFSFQRFVKAVSKVSKRKMAVPPEHKKTRENPLKKEIYIKSGHEHIKITIDDIHHITSDSDYTEIITAEWKYVSSEPLRFWLETLPNDQFCRVHRSHIVNTGKIEKIIGNQVLLKEGVKLPIGRAYKDDFMQRILK
ncbi:LytTR family DNA-binding domain-containing protein [Allomuricauda sp. SCSIO 65647]|uniref:LytR/AlgR family response regulator transcription factor n=1 Tax=Allomuricauda sp. SCSIO 65647 TaxID=2908843 RepID=UPI001F1E7914|nr:response regulator transcription factor [Muricauda sp. SCSIO 65647]UJH66375.1 response regulator transcription factor [Muricauda sp. SCSIO 65647]